MQVRYEVLCWARMSLIVGILVGYIPGPADAGEVSDRAYPLVTGRVTAHQNNFFVYRDADSGLNHGVPSGFFGEFQLIELDAACVDDPDGVNGCTTNPLRVDQEIHPDLGITRGTVLRITFDAFPEPSQFAGVNFEEPENFGVDRRGRGYDLTGATHLEFDVRSPTESGIRVQFGAGISPLNPTTPFMDIPAEWTPISIRLRDLAPAPRLTDVRFLFTVVTNDENAPTGGTVLLDNIRFTPAPTSQQDVLGLPLSYESFGVLPVIEPVGDETIPPDQVNRNIATIHDASLAALALLAHSTEADLQSARLIADTFSYALQHDNPGAPILPAESEGVGLHSAYKSGDLALFNDQANGPARQGDIQFAGFSAGTTVCGSTRFCLVLDGATGGNNAFAMLTLIAAFRQFDDAQYLEDARTIGRWIVDRLTDTTNRLGIGGYYVGVEDGGSAPRELIMGKSTENNAAIFSAFSALAAVEQELGNEEAATMWTTHATFAGDFVRDLFNGLTGCFAVGTFIDQSGQEVANTAVFLDAQTIPTLALSTAPRYREVLDWRLPVGCVLNNLSQRIMVGEEEFDGFHLAKSSPTIPLPPGIAWEFTAQTVVAMQAVDRLFSENRFAQEISDYLAELAQAQQLAPFTDGMGLVGSTRPEVAALPPREHCLPTPFQCIPMRVGLAATNWAIFADQGVNPFPEDRRSPPAQTRGLFNNGETRGGCTLIPGGEFEPTLVGLLGSVLALLALRRARVNRLKRRSLFDIKDM